jgi:hypothetical protein
LFFLKVGEIISIYAYAFLINFIESSLLLMLTLFLSIVLPSRWWMAAFTTKGFVLILAILGSAILHLTLYRTPDTREVFVRGQFAWWVATLLIAFVLTWLAGGVEWMRHALESVAERFVIFLYVYLPLTVFALLIVLIRIYL